LDAGQKLKYTPVKNRTYPAKILLVGEYAVLRGSPFLLTPYHAHFSQWSDQIKPHPKWAAFTQYLIQECSDFLNAESILRDISKGWMVDLQIPIGYGIGSSGTLCAAIYDSHKKDEIRELEILKSRLALMENFFHGKSSGLDPLVSLLDKSITGQKEEIQIVDFSLASFPQIKLVDSGRSRSTAKYVAIFKEKLNNHNFNQVLKQLLETNKQLISSLLQVDQKGAECLWKQVSELQLKHFSEMIPEHIYTDWEAGLASNAEYFKLCGAGGGGYFLKWTKQ